MEPYYNMNSCNGSNCRNPMNTNCRTPMKSGCNPCHDNRSSMRPERGACNNMCPPLGSYRNNRNCSNSQMEQRMNSDRMQIECECKVSSKKGCYKNDPMEQLGHQFPTVMAYVPWQQWGEMYDANCGLMQGTLFKELNLIFCGVRC